MTLRIIKAGPLSLLQDLGRIGYQGIGVTVGGPMDEHAFRWANHLLGNAQQATQIEITLGGFQAEFTQATQIALTGADMHAKLDETPLQPWASYHVPAGSVLTCQMAKQGVRAYLAIQGGFVAPDILGSCATVVRDQLGGLQGDGQALKKGDVIDYQAAGSGLLRQVPMRFIPHYWAPGSAPCVLDVLAGYQYAAFSIASRQQFFRSIYDVTPSCDRMGYRLSGKAIHYDGASLISEGIALGAIQIPADGQPIVLMADHQTIGGYPKIGCLTRMSVSKLAQCPPNAQVRFQLIEREQAEAQYRQRLTFFNLR
ncbi:5-oxoprolinase subunit C family protein [Vibrio aphrogenes]|uniref:5-oxoprolinase subunit C family protein n=1 Tax=Vibrio aphrogenes TaxID=1891186 RepID=UPI000B358286|nr:biotin-dependent carboxyltransferase family protein [Vibrio aphrogenes]